MGTAIRNTLLILAFVSVLGPVAPAQDATPFKEVDSTTYALYEQGSWKELAGEAKKAFREGYDYFYLRLRAGIAWYELGRFLQASIHLEKALEFNPGDRYARELLYYAYLMQNKGNEALRTLHGAPPSLQEELRKASPPRLHFLHADGSWFFSDQDNEFRKRDLDGPDDIYGEADIMNHAYAVSAGGRWFPARWYSGYFNYRYLALDKNKLAMSGDNLMADHPYLTQQHQFYHSSSFYPGMGITITPAFHFIHYSLNTIFPTYDALTGDYDFPDSTVADNNYIGFLGIKKDLGIIHAGVFGAAANLNGSEQYQAGFELTSFPMGNLDLYLLAQFVGHFNDSDLQPVVNAMAGVKILRPIWVEISGSFGKRDNYFEKEAYAVYNFKDRIRFKAGAKMTAMLSGRWMLSLSYEYLAKQADILFYKLTGGNDQTEVAPAYRPVDFVDQYLTASILWKL